MMALTAGGTLAFYAYTTYMQKFLVNTSGFDRETATQITAAALLVFMLLQPVAGALSDRIGRKPLMIGFGVLGLLLTVPIFTTLESVRNPYRGLRAGARGAGDRHRLHLDQRGGEGRAVPRPYPRARASPCPMRSPTRSSAAPPNMSRSGSRIRGSRAPSTGTSPR